MNHHHESLEDKEWDRYVLFIGSLLCMVTNKTLNPTTFSLLLLEDVMMQNTLLYLTGADSLQEALLEIFKRFPQTCSSKTITTKLRENGKRIREMRL